MTNGEKFKEVFQISQSQVDEGELYAYVWLPTHDAIEIPLEWWNAEYKEPTTKNDLGVDCISKADAIRVASGYCHPSNVAKELAKLPPVTPQEPRWIPVSERLPDTDNENNINNYNVLLWVKNKSHPEREPQIYLGKLRHIDGDDGSGNFWGVEIKPCDWTIWGWSYFSEPEVLAWMPLPAPFEPQESEEQTDD